MNKHYAYGYDVHGIHPCVQYTRLLRNGGVLLKKRHLPNAKIITFICLAALLIGLMAPGAARAGTPADRIGESVRVLREMSEQSDVEAMARLLKNAKGIAVFPSVIKAGIMLGGRYGEGLVLRRDPEKGTWYGPDFVKIKGISYGPQFGFQSTALVLVIANEEGMKGFMGDKVTLGGDLAVAVGPVGRQAGAATDADLQASIYSYSMSKGIFAGVSLEGAVIQPDESANELYWKSALRPDEILGRKTTDPRVQPLIKEIDHILLIQSAMGARSGADWAMRWPISQCRLISVASSGVRWPAFKRTRSGIPTFPTS